ncbi:MAG: hydroxyacid dehydrogenase [Oligoflexus sp.]|nr:hydroxyacid dehydrogenase [Oligoflexus sp.]
MAAPLANAELLVTATSFMRNVHLREDLEKRLSPRRVHYLDLRDAVHLQKFNDPNFSQAIHGWLVGGEPVTDAELAKFPNLLCVSKYGVGVDNIDFDACAARGVRVHFESGVNSLHVAEHTLGLIIGLCRNINLNSRMLSTGVWNKDGGRGLQGMKVGIIGLGHVGSKVAGLLKMLGADLAYCDILEKSESESSLGIQRLGYQDIISWAELLSFHLPLTDQTRKMFAEEEISKVKPGVFVVNTSRGAILDQRALKMGLNSGQIAGLALDVFEKEPLHDKELAESERLVGTPHTAGNSEQAVEAMGQAAIRGVLGIFTK